MAQSDFTPHISSRQPRTIFLPEGFDPRDALPFGVHKWSDGIRVVIDLVTTGGILADHRNGWVSLSRDAMSDLFGNYRTWSKIRTSLIDRGVLECDEMYAYEGASKTKWYRLLSPWRERPTEPAVLRDDRYAGWIDAREKCRPDRESWHPVHEWLDRRLADLTIDMGKAIRLASGLPWEKKRRAILASQVVASGCRRTLVDPFGFRFHSVVSSMPRVCRPALSFRSSSSPLVELDLSNAQPFLLGLSCLLLPVHPSSVNPNHWKGERGREANHELPAFSLLRASLHRRYQFAPMLPCVGVPDDLIDYLTVCSSGRYYEAIAEFCGFLCEGDGRRLVKKYSCRLMYGKTPTTSPRWAAYCERWPTVAERMAFLKADDHRRAAMELQRDETDLMLRGVCDQLRRSHPGLPIATIHDAILVPAEYESLVRDEIQRTIGCFGFPVPIKSS